MEDVCKRELGTGSFTPFGKSGGGFICVGQAYATDNGNVWVKINKNNQARQIFEGELSSLKAFEKTRCTFIPKPIKVIDFPDGSALLMDYIEMTPLSRQDVSWKLGEQLARVHLHNKEIGKRMKMRQQSVHHKTCDQYVSQFGFPVPTFCGNIIQDNTWCTEWPEYIGRKINYQIGLLDERFEQINSMWLELLPQIYKFFDNVKITPALIHGDFHRLNVAQVDNKGVMFDPCSFYGHSEYDLALTDMTLTVKFDPPFFEAYHSIIPKADGFDNRQTLYKLFHYLNNWNHLCFSNSSTTPIAESLKSLLDVLKTSKQ